MARLTRRAFLTRSAGTVAGLAALSLLPASPALARQAPAVLRQGAGEVTWWMFGGVPGALAWNKKKIAEFEQQSGIKVNYVERDWAKQREDLLAALTAGSVPDVIHTHNKYVAEFGESGDLYELEQFADWSDFSAQFVPGYLATTEHKGKHYGLPHLALVFVMAVNQPMLDAAGVTYPQNWDEFKAAVRKLAKPDQGIYGYTIPGGVNLDSAYRFAPWLYKGGGRVLSPDWKEATFNREAGVAALEMLLELQAEGAIPKGNAAYAFAENSDLWGSQKAALSTEGPWWQNVMREQFKLDPEAILRIEPIPPSTQPLESNPQATLLDMTMLAIMAGGKNTEGAWELLKFLRGPASDKDFVDPNNGGGLPTTKPSYEDASLQWKYIGKDTYFKEAQHVETWPNHPRITEIQLKLAEGLNAAFSGAAGAKAALDKAAADVNQLLES